MGLGTGQSRDGRRRRVLLDETLAGERPVAKSTKSMKRRRNYTDAALNDLQPRITDLIPTKWSTISILFGAGLTAIAAVVALYVYRDQLGSQAFFHRDSPLSFDSRGSLADWLSSVFFLMGALVASQVFAIRRHRLDDYRGSYRVWLWVTPLLLWLSIDSVTHLRAPLADAISKLPWFPKAHATWWWVGTYVTIFGIMAIRLIIETRRCRASWPTLVIAAVLYALSFAAQRGMFEIWDPWTLSIARRLPAMLGHWSVLLSLVLYARYVHLDAEGKLRAKKPTKTKKAEIAETADGKPGEEGDSKSKAQAASPSDAKESRILRTDGAHSTPPKPNTLGAFIAGSKGASSTSSTSSDEEEDDDDRGLSRAERRRLKKANR
jgi:hypothetical protein